MRQHNKARGIIKKYLFLELEHKIGSKEEWEYENLGQLWQRREKKM